MSAYQVDSTNNTLTAATNWAAMAAATSGYRYVEVTNLDGASAVTYLIGHTDPANPTSLQADAWILPAAVGASRTHDLADGDPEATSKTYSTGLFVDVISAGTPKVLVSAW